MLGNRGNPIMRAVNIYITYSEIELRGKLQKSKKQYYVDYFNEHINNIKRNYWDGIKKLLTLRTLLVKLRNCVGNS